MSGATSSYVPRFPPGIAEAGFFPGVMYYLTTWLPDSARRRAGALFLGGSATAYIVTGPISGALLEMRGLGGFAGWRWMFAREGAPSRSPWPSSPPSSSSHGSRTPADRPGRRRPPSARSSAGTARRVAANRRCPGRVWCSAPKWRC
nr:hypothetical protein OG546_43360 [Streptomyces antimycoticus]